MAFLLEKSLSPLKDLEQPVSASFSSSMHVGGCEEKNVGTLEEGREELEEEDAELNSLSPVTFSKISPSISVSSIFCSVSAPGSESITGNLFSSLP